MIRIPRRRLMALAATAAAGLGLAPRVRAQPVDVPGAYEHVPLLPGVAGPYSALAGVDPGLAVPAEWQPRGGAVAALPALPGHLQAFVDQAIAWKPAQSGITYHSYGYGGRRIGFLSHIPVARSLASLTAYFTSPNTAGLTHFGVGREHLLDLVLDMPDGSRWSVPVSPVHQYLEIAGERSPWSAGIIATSSACAIAQHPLIAGMRSGEPNGAFCSAEVVAMTGADGVTPEQFNSTVFLRAMCATYFGFEIGPNTQLWHAQVDQRNRCFDPGWYGGPFGGLEIEMQDAANAVLRGDLSRLKNAVRISAPPPAINAQDEAWKALVNTRIRNSQDAIRIAVREDYDQGREAALTGIDPSNWLDVAIQVWQDQEVRAADDAWLATVRRDAARAQLARLGG